MVVPYTDLEEMTRFRAFLVLESSTEWKVMMQFVAEIHLTLYSVMMVMIFYAGLGPNLLTGGGGSMLSGGVGDDLLIGGGGHDVLSGGPGHDKFDCKGESDLILDFNPKDDVASNNCILAT